MNALIETIAALATPPGRGGVGIIRVSGPLVKNIALVMLGQLPRPRLAELLVFKDPRGEILDEGLALFFPHPHSFTGEDVLELQGHGGPIILDRILRCILSLGARLAQPGEFSQRAFLNDKLDLVQAEAIADLIDSSSEQAARSALRSLQGEFSRCINELLKKLIELRVYVEAAIDFPEEEIDFISEGKVIERTRALLQELEIIKQRAHQGVILREGINIVIAGKPNAGKSSLLNQLAGRESAIVTDIPGTTRDILREYIHLDGIPVHLIDTAGLRPSADPIEQEGIKRALAEIKKADRILLLVDAQTHPAMDLASLWKPIEEHTGVTLPSPHLITIVRNKIDLTQEQAGLTEDQNAPTIAISAKTGAGIDALIAHLKSCILGNTVTSSEGCFSARRRHLDALERTERAIHKGLEQVEVYRAGELLAEELRLAQNDLSEITGEFTPDDLLGEIFSSFCIGK